MTSAQSMVPKTFLVCFVELALLGRVASGDSSPGDTNRGTLMVSGDTDTNPSCEGEACSPPDAPPTPQQLRVSQCCTGTQVRLAAHCSGGDSIFFSVDRTGSCTGFVVDVLLLLAKRTGAEIKVENVPRYNRTEPVVSTGRWHGSGWRQVLENSSFQGIWALETAQNLPIFRRGTTRMTPLYVSTHGGLIFRTAEAPPAWQVLFWMHACA